MLPAGKKRIVVLLAAVLWLTAVNAAPANPEVFDKVMAGTGWVVHSQNGQLAFGTCWVVDRDNKLVVTNQHVVGTAKNVQVVFPVKGCGQWITDPHFYYEGKLNYPGRVVAVDVERDLALVQLERMPDHVRAVPLAETGLQTGQTVYSVGNSGMAGVDKLEDGSLWRQRQGKVVAAGFTVLPRSDGPGRPVTLMEARVVVSDSGVYHGDSGGPLVNDQGQLVGVVAAFAEKNKAISISIDVSEVRAFLQTYSNGPAPINPAVPVVGTWTVKIHNPNAPAAYLRLTFAPDGTLTLDNGNATLLRGHYVYSDGALDIVLPSLRLRQQVELTWTGDLQQFTFSDAVAEFEATRR